MILQALYDYYQRKACDPDPARRLPAFGLEDKEIPFIIELTAAGKPLGIVDTRQGEGKKKVAQVFRVPESADRSANVEPNFLWDTAEYVLGTHSPKKLAESQKKNKEEKYMNRVVEMHNAFIARIQALPDEVKKDPGINAVLSFYSGNGLASLTSNPYWSEIAESNPNITFRLYGDSALICQRPCAVSWSDSTSSEEGEILSRATCLITGKAALPNRLETKIKGVWNAQPAGANIASFDKEAFTSFNKTQGSNAPVSPAAAFAYTTALNHLLDKNSRQRLQVGDASTVFWAQKEDADAEDGFAAIFGGGDAPDQAELIRGLLSAVHTGQFDGGRGENRFFVLGLAPNAARLSVRFWYAEPLVVVAEKTQQWFEDLDVIRLDFEPPYPALKRLLAAICLPTKEKPFGDVDKLPDVLTGDVMRAVLSGGMLPALILNATLHRCRADQARKDGVSGKPVRHVSSLRAALIKAYLNRFFKIHAPERKEIAVSLDRNNTDPSYLRGRLFALFERIQEVAAERELNRTIRDSFFGSAMATPRAVFPRLVRLNQQHLRDLKRRKPGTAIYFDKELLEVNNGLNPSTAFPAASPLHEQGVFTIGYYHQRQVFFSKNESTESTQGESK